MEFGGLQKLTLLDYPDKVACTVFTAGCNLRCPFCHNAPLVAGEGPFVAEEEVLAFLKSRRGRLDGVCVSGGEPLLHPGLEDFLCAVKAMGYDVKLDTNGCFPGRLAALAQKGLVDYVAMDIKNSPARYGATAGVKELDLQPIKESAAFLLAGGIDYEFRTTVVQELHTIDDFEAIGRWLAGARRYYLQPFEASGNLLSPGLHPPEKEFLAEALAALRPHIPAAALRGG